MLSESGRGCTLGWAGGSGTRVPVPGRLEEGGEEAGAEPGRTQSPRWDFSAREESGAGARPRQRSAGSGAAGAGGGGGGAAAGTKAGESRSRPASMGRLAPRPLLLALLSLGECARGAVGCGGADGAQLQRAAWGAQRAGAAPGRPGGEKRAARPGGERPRGRPEPGANAAGPRAGCRSRPRQAEARPGRVPGEWRGGCFPQPSLPVGRRKPGSP